MQVAEGSPVRVWRRVVPKMWKDFAAIAAIDAAFSIFGFATGTAVLMGLLDAAVMGKSGGQKIDRIR